MKKILIVVVVLALLAIAALFLAMQFTGSAVRMGIERFGPTLTGTEVEVEKVEVSFLRGEVVVENLRVGNPDGYNEPDAIRFTRLVIRANPRDLFGEIMTVDEIVLTGMQLTYEQKATTSNIREIQQHLAAVTAPDEEAPPSVDDEDEDAVAHPVVIRRLFIEDGSIRIAGAGMKATHQLDPIVLENIGTQNDPATLATALGVILQAILTSAGGFLTGFGAEILDRGSELLDQGGEQVRSLLRGLQD